MSKLHKILIIVFCCGVLICGLGTGIMLTEAAGLTYGGTQMIGPTDMKTEIFKMEFESGEEVQKIESWYLRNIDGIRTDRSVPRNTVRFEVTYDASRISPEVYTDETNGRIHFSWYWVGGDDDLASIMEAKDVVLQNLKEGRLVAVERPDVIEKLTITVNPADKDRVKLIY